MATAAMSCVLAGVPKSNLLGYPWARAGSGTANAASAAAMSSAQVRSTERVHIRHAPVSRDAPALDRVHVIEQRAGLERPALGDELLVRRLRIPGLIRRPALDHRRLAIPYPGKAEARLADRQYRFLQRRQVPAFSAVGRHFNARDLSPPAPGEPGDLVKARPRQRHLARRKGDR